MKYGIAIFPSKTLQDKANSYRKRYDTNYSLIAPHVTIKAAFEASDAEIKNIEQKIEDVVTHFDPMVLKVLKASTFQPVSNTIYFKVEPSIELEGLYNAFNQEEFAGAPSPYNFVPHITIGQNLSINEHSDVLGQLSMLDLTHQEVISEIQLMKQNEQGTWNVYKTYKLGKE